MNLWPLTFRCCTAGFYARVRRLQLFQTPQSALSPILRVPRYAAHHIFYTSTLKQRLATKRKLFRAVCMLFCSHFGGRMAISEKLKNWLHLRCLAGVVWEWGVCWFIFSATCGLVLLGPAWVADVATLNYGTFHRYSLCDCWLIRLWLGLEMTQFVLAASWDT